jgi:hypothetical protein
MAFPMMYTTMVIAPIGDPIWKVSPSDVYRHGTSIPSSSRELLDIINNGNKLVYTTYASCREQTLGVLQSWLTRVYPFVCRNCLGRIYITFSISGHVAPNLGKASLDCAGYGLGGASVQIDYKDYTKKFVVEVGVDYFDIGKMSVLLFCLSRFPEMDVSNSADYIRKIIDDPSGSFPNNGGFATYMSYMMGFALYSRMFPNSYTSSTHPMGYNALGGSVLGIVDLMKTYCKRYPQEFLEFCRRYQVSLPIIDQEFPFSKQISWRKLSDHYVNIEKELTESIDSWDGWGDSSTFEDGDSNEEEDE